MTQEFPAITAPSHSWMRGFFERCCLAGVVVYTMATTVLIGLSLELVVFHFILVYAIGSGLIDQHTEGFLGCGALALLNFPLVMKAWAYGTEHLNFEYYQGQVDELGNPPEGLGNWLLAFLDESASTSANLVEKVESIWNAPANDRQTVRAEVKAWVLSQRDNFNDLDREYIRDNIGYMLTAADITPASAKRKKNFTP